MKLDRILPRIAATAAMGALAVSSASAQVIVPGFGAYGYTGPSFTVTPYGGVVPLGYGYNGYTGSGYADNGEWDVLRQAYSQGFQEALAQARAQDAQRAAAQASEQTAPPSDNEDTTTLRGMTATPPGAVHRVPHGADSVRSWRVGRQVALRWQGDPRTASSVKFELTDSSGRTLRSATVSQLPAEVHLTPPPGTAFYRATVQYVDGANNTIMSTLPR